MYKQAYIYIERDACMGGYVLCVMSLCGKLNGSPYICDWMPYSRGLLVISSRFNFFILSFLLSLLFLFSLNFSLYFSTIPSNIRVATTTTSTQHVIRGKMYEKKTETWNSHIHTWYIYDKSVTIMHYSYQTCVCLVHFSKNYSFSYRIRNTQRPHNIAYM